MTDSAATTRKNVRAKLHLPVVLTGTSREGRPFRIAGESSDFSRAGLGVILEQDVLTQGLLVTVSSGGRFRANATVQWIGRGRDTDRIHVGLRVVEAKASIGSRAPNRPKPPSARRNKRSMFPIWWERVLPTPVSLQAQAVRQPRTQRRKRPKRRKEVG